MQAMRRLTQAPAYKSRRTDPTPDFFTLSVYKRKKGKNRTNILPDSGGKQQQYPYAQAWGRTCKTRADEAVAPGQKPAGRATTSGWRARQEGEELANADVSGGWRVRTADDTPCVAFVAFSV